MKQFQDVQAALKSANDKHAGEMQKLREKLEQEKALVQQNLESLIQQMKGERSQLEVDLQKQNQRLLEENQRLLQDVRVEKEKFLDQQKQYGDDIIVKSTKINELQIKNEALQKELDNIRNTNKGWEQISKEKIDIIMNEKAKLAEELSKNKLRHKEKLKELR